MYCIVHGVAETWTQLSDFHFQSLILKLEIQLEFEKLHIQVVVLQDVLQLFNMIYCFGELVVLQLIDIYMYININIYVYIRIF